ncbi:MAG: hypothetical protein SVW02_02740 [Candidatus Nanohaloarchaea archaeon]|nr:hypothetical protein [Candidatus Nanohaloarchaea archaeon]
MTMEREQIEKNKQDLLYQDYLSRSNIALAGAIAGSIGILGIASGRSALNILAATYTGAVLVALGIRYRRRAEAVRQNLQAIW